MINYPNGKIATKAIKNETNNKKEVSAKLHLSTRNRGMDLENDINLTNEYYKENNLCLVTKRPTPINVVKVDYSKGAIITNAYFEKQSTTDYNGVYMGKYIDFEAKSTHSKTSFSLSNIPLQQINHLKGVLAHKGIAFFIIEFVKNNEETYLIDAQYVIDFYESKPRASIPYKDIKLNGELIKRGYSPRLDYLPIIKRKYF